MSSKEKKEKKDKSASKEKKEKKDKSQSKEKKDKKDKSESKDKKDKSSKSKDKSSSKKGDDKDIKMSASGRTTYRRQKDKVEKGGKSKTNVLWIPEGMTADDKQFVWQEQKESSGSGVFYFNLADPEKREWELPDVPGGTPSAVDADEPSAPVLQKKKLKPKKNWKDETAQKSVMTAAKKSLSAAPGNEELSKDEYNILSANVAIDFMAEFQKLDAEGEKWIDTQIKKEAAEYIEKRNAAQVAAADRRKRREALTLEKTDDDDAPLPQDKLESGPPPLSPLLPRAWYLRDPWYQRRLKAVNDRRSDLEARIDEQAFIQPGQGVVKTLAAVPVVLGERGDRNVMACVVRDWVGAFNLMFVDYRNPGTQNEQATVVEAYPILEHVEFAPGHQKVEVRLDDIKFIMTFGERKMASYLQDSLKLAMCSMYGQGNDDKRITSMRASSLEFSSLEMNYYPGGSPPDANQVAIKVLSEENREGADMDKDFELLRLCMRTPEGRSAVIRQWIRSVDEGLVLKSKSPPMLHNHLRVIEEANRAPAYHEEATLTQSILSHLTILRTDQPEAEKTRIEAIKTTTRIVDQVMDTWQSRSTLGDIEFGKCFEAVRGSEADLMMKKRVAMSRANYAASQLPPGIMISMLCFCGNQVLVDVMGNLFTEVIVAQPTEKELAEFNASSEDFRWILRMGGADENWASRLQHWAAVYDNVGWNTFRYKFVQSARRLLEQHSFPTLGYILDVPVVQKGVSCAHVLCVNHVESKDKVPVAAGEWVDIDKFEQQAYIQAMVATHNTRIGFLSTSYNNCLRYVKAAVDYRQSLSGSLDAGFYCGHLVFAADSHGPMILVPESNRVMPPMVLVSNDMPTLENWRWIQGLNERMRRTQTFGLDYDLNNTNVDLEVLAFEQRFAKAVKELEHAMGLPIRKFYDTEMFVLDEGQQARGVFAAHAVQQSFARGMDDLSIPTPNGAVKMVWKHLDVVEESYLRLHWPKVFGALTEERDAQYRKAYSTAQPFAVDEVVRLRHESALQFYTDMEKFVTLLSWGRPVYTWIYGDARSLVEKFGGGEDETIARSIEEAVEVSVTNHSTTTDINVQTMQSLLVDAASGPHFSWATLLAKLREIDRVVSTGYMNRMVTSLPSKKNREVKLRSYDELYGDEESDDEIPREATVYEVPCTLEELIFKDVTVEGANKYFQMQEIVNEIIDIAAVDCVDVGSVKEIGGIITDMISVIETSDELIDNAALLALKTETEQEAWSERERFQKQWLEVFQNDKELLDQASKRSGDEVGSRLGAGAQTGASEGLAAVAKLADEEDLDGPMSSALFYDGSPHTITNFTDGVKVCIAKAQNSCFALQQMMKVANSASEALELVQVIQDYSATVTKRESLLGSEEEQARVASENRSGLGANVSGTGAPGASVTIVSKEFHEFPIRAADPLRCLVLNGVSGKVRFPTITTATMEVLAQHLESPDFNVPQQLADFHYDTHATEQLLEMALQMKSPILTLRFATLLFGSASGTSTFFTSTAALQLRQLVQEGFMFEYGIKDWLHMEVLGGEPIAAAMDVLWWVRYAKEPTADASVNERPDVFADHEGNWKQSYAESRVRAFLSYGVHSLNRDEVALWSQSLGRYVEYLSLREKSIGDPEVEVLVASCQNLKSLDVSYTSVTSRSVELLVMNCRQLVECAVAGCDLSPQDHDALRRHTLENKRRAVS